MGCIHHTTGLGFVVLPGIRVINPFQERIHLLFDDVNGNPHMKSMTLLAVF